MSDTTHPSTAPQNLRIPLKQLGLRAGMALQTRRLVEGTSKKESQYIGAIESKGVMVGPIGADAEQTGLTEGEVCVVRGFTGQYEFSFVSKVLQTFEKPFVYTLLAYPTSVDAQLVRQSMRVKMNWPTQVKLAQGAVLGAMLVDLSTAGAMLNTPAPIGAVGEDIGIDMLLDVEGTEVSVHLKGRICHTNRIAADNTVCSGVAFVGATAQDKMALGYVTQTQRGANA
ncbi:PilZ domain-containing protein [Curvibacter sp. APW13]|uniref:PilZ domain-containing protein n=1 Tax=Curvibacter sp. APW13 TaxID=3077236 RepID=UPI0028DF7CEF|nr:PilZ domain-containing protein [Curvibacter sp. APW13]MDT8991470.1 PilZ domain-containing protein [Curvibacter sp. APW13]